MTISFEIKFCPETQAVEYTTYFERGEPVNVLPFFRRVPTMSLLYYSLGQRDNPFKQHIIPYFHEHNEFIFTYQPQYSLSDFVTQSI